MNYELLEKARENKGLTQENMASLLGYKSKGSYCLIENGKAKLTLDIAKKIKDILNLSNKEFNDIFFSDSVQDSSTFRAVSI